jgi:mannosyltransferase OCH1-like enzyme
MTTTTLEQTTTTLEQTYCHESWYTNTGIIHRPDPPTHPILLAVYQRVQAQIVEKYPNAHTTVPKTTHRPILEAGHAIRRSEAEANFLAETSSAERNKKMLEAARVMQAEHAEQKVAAEKYAASLAASANAMPDIHDGVVSPECSKAQSIQID